MGDPVISSDSADIKPGNNLALSAIPVGTLIHNIEVTPGKGGKLGRSAGNYASSWRGRRVRAGKDAERRNSPHSLALPASIGQLSNTRSREHHDRQGGAFALARASAG